MKAILVINAPDNISFKRLERAQISFYNQDSGRYIYRNARLKPLPQKKVLDKELFMTGNFKLVFASYTGWNDCIDEILGGQDNV